MSSPTGRRSSARTRADRRAQSGAATVDELAAHLEDIYLDAIPEGLQKWRCIRTSEARIARVAADDRAGAAHAPPEARPARSRPTAAGGSAVAAAICASRGASCGARRRFATVAIVTLGLGAGRGDRDLHVVNADPASSRSRSRRPQQLVTLWEQNSRSHCRREHCRR